MTPKPEQLLLDLPTRQAFGRDDFLVTSSNAAAVALIDQWPDWPTHGAIIVGPAGSGKSHLVEVWRQASGGVVRSAVALQIDAVPSLLENGALAIEDVESSQHNERALFHALNLAKQQAGHILLTMQAPPSRLRFAIADLASRLNALPLVNILPPDDALLRGVLVKQFADRQIHVDEGLISYILLRMPRSLEAARNLVSQTDRLALLEKAEVTKPLLARVLVKIATPDLFTNNF